MMPRIELLRVLAVPWQFSLGGVSQQALRCWLASQRPRP
jgi:hypothetical protein